MDPPDAHVDFVSISSSVSFSFDSRRKRRFFLFVCFFFFWGGGGSTRCQVTCEEDEEEFDVEEAAVWHGNHDEAAAKNDGPVQVVVGRSPTPGVVVYLPDPSLNVDEATRRDRPTKNDGRDPPTPSLSFTATVFSSCKTGRIGNVVVFPIFYFKRRREAAPKKKNARLDRPPSRSERCDHLLDCATTRSREAPKKWLL